MVQRLLLLETNPKPSVIDFKSFAVSARREKNLNVDFLMTPRQTPLVSTSVLLFLPEERVLGILMVSIWKKSGPTTANPGMSEGSKSGQWQGQRQDPQSNELSTEYQTFAVILRNSSCEPVLGYTQTLSHILVHEDDLSLKPALG